MARENCWEFTAKTAIWGGGVMRNAHVKIVIFYGMPYVCAVGLGVSVVPDCCRYN